MCCYIILLYRFKSYPYEIGTQSLYTCMYTSPPSSHHLLLFSGTSVLQYLLQFLLYQVETGRECVPHAHTRPLQNVHLFTVSTYNHRRTIYTRIRLILRSSLVLTVGQVNVISYYTPCTVTNTTMIEPSSSLSHTVTQTYA